MSDIKSWSNSAGGNNSTSPNGFPEGMSPSSVNDSARELMAAIRRQHENAEWINFGDTPTFQTTATFTLAGDKRTAYHIGRRIRCSDASTLYGKISDCTYSANTRISVTLGAGGELSSSLTSIAVGILSFTNQSIPEVSATAAYARSAGYATSAGHSTTCVSAGFAGSASLAATITDGTNVIRTKIIDMGDWNMDANEFLTVTHNLSLSKIRSIDAWIRSDADDILGSLISSNGLGVTGYIRANATIVTLGRVGTGAYDTTAYDATSFNRGWVKIVYID